MIFRPAILKDIPQIQRVRHSVVENVLSDPGAVTDRDVAEYLKNRGKGWVCEMDGHVVGFAIVDLADDNVWALFVHPDYEGRGIGSRLHDLMLEWYFEQDKQRIWLSTSPGTKAEKFYRLKGWQETGTKNNGEIIFEKRTRQEPVLSVRELQSSDIPQLVRYWSTASPILLTGMGVDLAKLPSGAELTQWLTTQLDKPVPQRDSYALIWLMDDEPVGHTNANDIRFGESAYMHLHLWDSENRRKGAGARLLRKSLTFYFDRLQLHTLYCQPYALNPAPNKTLEKVGFEFVKRYVTTPGSINFEQEVNLYRMTREQYQRVLQLKWRGVNRSMNKATRWPFFF